MSKFTEIRRSRDLSLGESARAMGLLPSLLSAFEHGRIVPTAGELSTLATFYGMTQDQVREALPSPEDIAAEEKRLGDFLSVLAACKRDAKERGFGRGSAGRGSVVCPIDGATVRYSVAAVNGHMWGRCDTEGCAKWME